MGPWNSARPASAGALLGLSLLLLFVPARVLADEVKQTLALGALDWMVGSWSKADGVRSAEEHWLPARGGLMLGLHRDVFADDRAVFEYLRIERRPEGIFYLASPAGRPATTFKLVNVTDSRAVFSNPEHDFPSRIIYWLEGGSLHARIEGQREGKPASQDFSWPRVESP